MGSYRSASLHVLTLDGEYDYHERNFCVGRVGNGIVDAYRFGFGVAIGPILGFGIQRFSGLGLRVLSYAAYLLALQSSEGRV